jgi:phenylacetate-CoA ligase
MLRDLPVSIIKKYPKIERVAREVAGKIPLSRRLGQEFWRWYSFFDLSEHWSVEQLQAYQMDCLRTLLRDLLRASPYYRERLMGVDIDRLDSQRQFSLMVPAMTRVEFRTNYLDILSRIQRTKDFEKCGTSGTTGNALQFYHSRKDGMREWAAICHQWKRVGYLPAESRRAEFRGLTTPDKLVDVFPDKNMIRCSILHLKAQHIPFYADAIRKHGIDFYHGYPSALYLLAREVCASGVVFPQPKAILLASEMVYGWQLDQIREAFPQSKLFAHYGCAERTVLAGWCEHRHEYHVMPQYSMVDIDPGTSEIIGTNLFNQINGFVRYRMTDTVLELSQEPCPDCNRPYVPRFIDLAGRSEEYLYSPEKGWIPPAIVTFPLKGLKAIQEIQFYQKERAEIVVRYTATLQTVGSRMLADELTQMGEGLAHIFGDSMRFQFEHVDDFAKTASGKFKWIMCELDDVPSISSHSEK